MADPQRFRVIVCDFPFDPNGDHEYPASVELRRALNRSKP